MPNALFPLWPGMAGALMFQHGLTARRSRPVNFIDALPRNLLNSLLAGNRSRRPVRRLGSRPGLRCEPIRGPTAAYAGHQPPPH
jgi:hypothetical protein